MQPVFTVTSEQWAAWMAAFIWPFVRMLALISTAPIFGESSIPRRVKVGLAAILAIVLSPTLGPMPTTPVVSVGGLWVMTQQVLIGGAMGFCMRMVFTAVQAAGEYISLQMGLSFASFFDPSAGGATMVVARLLNMLAMLLFLASNGHLMLIAALVDSFHTLPVADAPLSALGWMQLAQAGGQIFSTGLMLGLPLVTALLTLNLAMGILNRASPQFSIFAVGFPLTLLAGILMLEMLMPRMGPFLEPRFAAGLSGITNFVQALRP